MTKDEIAAIRARCERATPGPWKRETEGEWELIAHQDGCVGEVFMARDAEFIASASPVRVYMTGLTGNTLLG